MRVAVYANHLTQRSGYGIRNYLADLLYKIQALDEDLEVVLFARSNIVEFSMGGRCSFHKAPNIKGWYYFLFPYYCKKYKIDLILMPKESCPFFVGDKTISFAYDFMHLYFSEHLNLITKLHYFLAENFDLPRANRIVAISKSTKNDVVRRCKISPSRVEVIPPSCDRSVFYPRSGTEIATVNSRYKLSKPYFLNTSSVWWYRKNLINLIDAFARFNEPDRLYDLVITGQPGDLHLQMLEKIDELGIQENVRLLAKVAADDIPVLMSGATALVFPSLHEGFGMPIIEAMSCETPVITSNNSAMPEAGGDAAILVDPYSVDEISKAMHLVTSDATKRQSMIEKGIAHAARFNPETSASKLLDLMYSIGQNRTPNAGAIDSARNVT